MRRILILERRILILKRGMTILKRIMIAKNQMTKKVLRLLSMLFLLYTKADLCAK